jgi:hypothetical protein
MAQGNVISLVGKSLQLLTQRIYVPRKAKELGRRVRPIWIQLSLLVAACIFIMATQTPDTGFRRGHRGWVSSHILAIFAHANPENRFVGYSVAFDRGPRGKEYSYFDRYPVFFSATMHGLLYGTDLSLSQKVIVARQVMLLIHGLTLVMAFLLLMELGVHRWLALAAVCGTAAGHTFVVYRDMIHMDQPALLGMVLLCWAVAKHRNQPRPWLVVGVTVLAVSMGRGYASFAVLALWWLVELVETVWRHRFRPLPVLRDTFKNVASWCCVVAIVLCAGYVAYNVAQEASLRDVDIEQVSIVKSAKRRLPGTSTGGRGKTRWDNFLHRQGARFVEGFHPYGATTGFAERTLPLYWVLLLMFLMSLLFIAKLRDRRRGSALVVAFCGVLWLFAMRKLAAWHDYTVMYYLGTFLVIQVSFWRLFPERAYRLAAGLALLLLAATTWARAAELREESVRSNIATEDFEGITARLNKGDRVRIEGNYQKLLDGATLPFALGFYLADQWLANPALADYVVAKGRRASRGTNLTPHNTHYFLYRRAKRPK